MNIKEIRLINFKNIEDSKIVFRENLTGIYGPNGIGKTTIIEAIQFFKLYFSKVNKEEKNRRETFHQLLSNFMNINCDTFGIEVLLLGETYQYHLSIYIERFKGEFFCTKEELKYRGIQSKVEFKNLLTVTSSTEDIFPQVKFFHLETSDFQVDKMGNKETSLKEILKYYNEYFSFIFQLEGLDLISFLKKENDYVYSLDKKIEKFSNITSTTFKELRNILNNILTITLKDQITNQQYVNIPISCNDSGEIKTIIYNEKSNIYSQEDSQILHKSITEINSIISIIIPNSKLIFKSDIVGVTSSDNKIQNSILLYMMKNDNLIPLINESTGTLKLISLISVLIFGIRNKTSTIFIDELDVHIFEYLLATILLALNKYSKGQLVFTAHNLLPLEKLNKNSIIVATKNDDDIVFTNIKRDSKTNNIRLKYLKSQSMHSEDNISPLLINIPKLEVYMERLVENVDE